MKTKAWCPIWVEDMPEKMEDGEFYISPKHRLTEHLCACGCKAEVSVPLGRSKWKIEYDGETVSLWPSIGNWRLPCKSHYIIEENRTIWCRDVKKVQKKKWWNRLLGAFGKKEI